MFKLTALLVTASLLSACAQSSFTALKPGDLNKKTNPDFQVEGCAPDSIDYQLQVNVVSFAMTSDTGLSFGFDWKSGWFEGIQLDARIKKGQLELQGVLERPLKPSSAAIKVDGVGVLNDSSFAFKVDTTIVNVGVNTASQTSLAKLAKKGITEVIKNASKELKNDPNSWQTTVQAFDDEKHFKIPVGYRAGLVKGDQFNIFEERWLWKGTPCASEVDRHYHVGDQPIASAIVWDVEDDSATLLIVGTPTKAIKLGDTVEIAKLVKVQGNQNRSLKKSLRLLPAYSKGKVVVNKLGEIDIPYYLDYVTEPVLNSSQFWVADSKL